MFREVTRSYSKRFSSFCGVASVLALGCFAPNVSPADAAVLNPAKSAAQYIGCFGSHKTTLVSAHRGGPRPGFPENALETLQNTVSFGPVLLEVDVQETADGHLVLMHDAELDRTTNGTGTLSDFTLAELQSLRLVDNDGNETDFRIPTLESVLDWADERAILQLDVKRGVDFVKVAKAVVAAEAVDSTFLISYRVKDAVPALTLDNNLSFAVSIYGPDDLFEVSDAGFTKQQIVAWTGVVRTLDNPSAWRELERMNIPSSAGAMIRLEKQIMASNNPQPYIDLANAGVDIIASDYYQLAFETLNKRQNVVSVAKVCEGY